MRKQSIAFTHEGITGFVHPDNFVAWSSLSCQIEGCGPALRASIDRALEERGRTIHSSLLKGLSVDPVTFVWESGFPGSRELVDQRRWDDARALVDALGDGGREDLYRHLRDRCVYVPSID